MSLAFVAERMTGDGTEPESEAFRFAYDPPVIRYGEGCVGDLAAELDECDRALVVCGRTVGDTPAVIDPVRRGLGDRLAGVFAETTPEKRLSTAVAAARRLRETGATALVGVGGGSSLDIARVASVVAAAERTPEELGAALESTDSLPVTGDLPPVLVVPTTLAGADLSMLAGVTATPASGLVDSPVDGGVGDPRLMPAAAYYDPSIVATTPRSVLVGSAMNGFDKGIETLYARNRTAVTDGTATRGLALLRDGLPTLDAESERPDLSRILQGTILVQYGISRADGTTLSLLHAFGHGLTAHTDIQQGVAHAVVAPHALAWLFDRVDGRRRLLADALGVPDDDSTDALAEGVVDVVREVRDSLGLPARLRDLDIERSTLDAVAETSAEDSLLENAPPGLNPSPDALRDVLEAAW